MLQILDDLWSQNGRQMCYAWEGLVAATVAREANRTLQSTSIATVHLIHRVRLQIPLPVDAMD